MHDDRYRAAQAIVDLTRLALAAPDLPTAIEPTLKKLVGDTAAEGAAFFQADTHDVRFHVRSAWGAMPTGEVMAAVAAHGLPADAPLLGALRASEAPLFFDDVTAHRVSAGMAALGVASLAAAPVRDAEGRLVGAFLMHTFGAHAWTAPEAELFGMVSGTAAALVGRLAAEEEALDAREAALRALGLALEARDAETSGHTDHVTRLAQRMARRLDLDPAARKALRWGAYLHDVGKIAVPDAVLLKPGPLDADEWAVMRSHVESGCRFAHSLAFLPEGALDVIAQHHERWDGSGYPGRLREEEISLGARVFALCDVYDALVSERPYKRAWTHEAALREIGAQAGRQFDPALARVFLDVVSAEA